MSSSSTRKSQDSIRASLRRGRRTARHATRRLLIGFEALEGRVVPAFFVAPLTTGAVTPVAEVTGDFNGDGKLDIAEADVQGNDIHVFLGNGDGTFQPQTFDGAGSNPDAMAVGDFNGDGKLDIVTSDLDNTVDILLGNGDGTFKLTTQIPLPGRGTQMAVGDVNNDGHDDIIVNGEDFASNAMLLIGKGDGTFQSLTTLLQTGGQVALGDVNGDGKLDLVESTFTSPINTVDISLGNGDGTFGAPTALNTLAAADTSGEGLMSMKLADFNGDGKLDLAFSQGVFGVNVNGGTAFPGVVSVLLNNGNGTFRTPTDYRIDNVIPSRLTVGDFNGDGHPDLATVDTSTDTVSVLLNNGNGAFHFEANYGAGRGAVGILAGDFKGEGRDDIVTADSPSSFGLPGNLDYLASNSDGSFSTGQFTTIPNLPMVGQELLDVNGDGIPDLVTIVSRFGPNPGGGEVDGNSAVLLQLGLGDGTFGDLQDLNIGPFDVSFALADVNGDGLPDLEVDTLFPSPQFPADTVMLLLNTPDWSGVTAGAVALKVSAPQQVTAGGPFAITVSAVDANGNLVPGFHGSVSLDRTQAGSTFRTITDSYNFTPADGGQHTFITSSLTTAGAASISLFAAALPSVTVPITVTPAAPARFAISAPTIAAAGTAFPITVNSVDAFGNFSPSYLGTVSFTGGDPQGTLPANYTFTAADAGSHTFTVTDRTAGFQPVSVVTDTANPSITAVGPKVQITPIAAVSISVSVPTANPIFAGLAAPVTITLRDMFGNVASGYTGTVSLVSSDSRTSLPTSYKFTSTDFGVHTFAATFDTAGPHSLSVSDPTLTTVSSSSASFNVDPGVAAVLVVSGFPATTAGVAHSFTVSVFDAFGNLDTGFTGFVSFSSSDTRAGLPATYQFTAADAGIHIFTATFLTVGSQSLTVSDLSSVVNGVAVAGIVGSQAAIPVSAAAAASFTIGGFPATTAGVAHSFTVTALDAFGNVATGYTGTVSFSSSDVQAGLPASYTFTAADAGVHTFSATLKTAASQSITVKDLAAPTVAGTQAAITVTAASMSHFALSISQGKSSSLTVAAVDAFGNVIVGYRGKIHFSDSLSSSGLPSDYTFNNTDNGVHTFNVTLNTVGTQMLMVVDTSNSAFSGSLIVTISKPSGAAGGGATGGSGGGGGGGGGN